MKTLNSQDCALVFGGGTEDLGTAAGGLLAVGGGFVAAAGSAGATVTAGVVVAAALPILAVAVGGAALGYGLYSFFSEE